VNASKGSRILIHCATTAVRPKAGGRSSPKSPACNRAVQRHASDGAQSPHQRARIFPNLTRNGYAGNSKSDRHDDLANLLIRLKKTMRFNDVL
jgi:hypothetical protein